MPDFDITITGQVATDTITGQVDADAVSGDDVTEQAIIFLNHCDYDKLSCGGSVAEFGCDSVFRIREIDTEYVTRWIVSPVFT